MPGQGMVYKLEMEELVCVFPIGGKLVACHPLAADRLSRWIAVFA